MKEWTTPDCRSTSSTTNLKEEETVDAPGNDGITSMPEQVKRPNPWRKMMMMMMMMMIYNNTTGYNKHTHAYVVISTVLNFTIFG